MEFRVSLFLPFASRYNFKRELQWIASAKLSTIYSLTTLPHTILDYFFLPAN